MGASVVLGDPRFLWRAASTTARGIVLAIAMGFIVGHIVPGAGAQRDDPHHMRPSILDLAVALLAGAAAAMP